MKDIIYLGYFGSVVRADSDESSDTDILCVLKDNSVANELELRKAIHEETLALRNLDCSTYSHKRLIEMWKEGHLFAWHIYLESKPFKGFEGFNEIMGLPSKYSNSSVDILRLRELLFDVRFSLNEKFISKVYEAGLIYVAVRNIGISASWYSSSGLNFSRMSPYSLNIGGEKINFPIPKYTYAKLVAARHAAMRGGLPPNLDALELRSICDKLIKWSGFVLKKVEACHEC